MFNWYVDGLTTIAPDDPAVYAAGAQRLVMEGYLAPSAQPEREGTSRWRCAHTIIATPTLGAITMLPARRQIRAFSGTGLSCILCKLGEPIAVRRAGICRLSSRTLGR